MSLFQLKGKKRREKKAAKALSNIQELDNAEGTEFIPNLAHGLFIVCSE